MPALLPSVRLSRVSFQYEDPSDIFTDLTVHFGPGWTGVVGENGCGKTTLLSLLSGKLLPERGVVDCRPIGAAVHLCSQLIIDLPNGVASFASSWDRSACRLRARLNIEEEQLSRWSMLSPGERKRWQVAAALWQQPQVLLLDEPTNHLDVSARALLVTALRRFRGVGIIVSHDRALLDELCQRIVHLADGVATVHNGNYSVARKQWEAARANIAQAHTSARQHQRKVERRSATVATKRAAAEASISARSRIKGPRDSDARSVNARGRVAKAEARLSRQVHVLRTHTERAKANADSHHVQRQRGRSLFVDYVPAPMNRLLSLDHLDIRAGNAVVLHDVTVVVDRMTKVHVAGDNGSGKTTMLRALLAAAGERRDRMLYVPQEIDDNRRQQLVAALRYAQPDVRDRTLTIAAAIGLDPPRVLASARPSPGELRKLMLAWGMASRVWAVLLDEPTNHLDLPSIERLETALAAYPGALVLVTHDDQLASSVTTSTWHVGAGSVIVN